jgi:hypothetical protein
MAVLSEEPLPPYELDPEFEDAELHKRIGDLIARAMMRELLKS